LPAIPNRFRHDSQTISDVFKRHGGQPLDTPVFERKEILSGKYGEDSKLIYDLQDQGGELLALRYDLTVPFARWLAMTGKQQVKRYHIAKVYRRDQPAINLGRFREFYQCDFDVAGVYDPMIPDSEIIRIIVEVFRAFDQDITIKINHRKILDGMFTVAGVADEQLRPISSAVDKLDKLPWAEVKKEMLEKGLDESAADEIGEYVRNSGSLKEILAYLEGNEKLRANADIQSGLHDMTLLSNYLEALDAADKVSFDLSLARGLDYYTGVIYEVIAKGAQVGSIAAGGRYDNLVGMFTKKSIPCVGISFGVDRIFTVLKEKLEKDAALQTAEADVFVMAFGGKDFNGFLLERLAVTRQLWDGGIKAGFMPKVKSKSQQQFKASETARARLGVILGEDEMKAGQVRLKVLGTGPNGEASDEKDTGKLISRDDLVAEVKKLLTPTDNLVGGINNLKV